MKPTREQMVAWYQEWCLIPEGPYEPSAVEHFVNRAYTAGRKAGLLEARAILASVNNFSNPMTCSDCIDEIDAAMEADK